MSSTRRFPLLVNGLAGRREISTDSVGNPGPPGLLIDLAVNTTQFDQGGPGIPPPGGYVDVTSWKQINYDTETPFCHVVIEFMASGAVTIGDGTPAGMIGLYGMINTPTPYGGAYLLGVLGVTLAGTKPQIPIFNSGVGYAQIVQNVALYDNLAVGGINGIVAFGPTTVTVRARPIRERDYAG